MNPTLRERIDRAAAAPGRVDVHEGGVRVRADVVEADRIGVVVERLRVDAGPGDIARRAEAVATNVRPAGQRLAQTEVDPGLGGAVLRTDPADIRGGRFYEVRVDPDGADVTRHRIEPDRTRAAEPFDLTRPQLGDLVDDLARSLHDPAQR